MPLSGVVAMQTRRPDMKSAKEIPLRRLVQEVLPMWLSPMVVGDVRQRNRLDLIDLASDRAAVHGDEQASRFE